MFHFFQKIILRNLLKRDTQKYVCKNVKSKVKVLNIHSHTRKYVHVHALIGILINYLMKLILSSSTPLIFKRKKNFVTFLKTLLKTRISYNSYV